MQPKVVNGPIEIFYGADSYKTAWFMAHRIREAMKPKRLEKLGGGSVPAVEADETFIGTKKGARKKAKQRGWGHKNTVFTLVQRGGEARSFHIAGNMFDGVKAALKANVSPEAYLMTDCSATSRVRRTRQSS